MRLRCSRCKKLFDGIDEHDAEVKFNAHNCKVKGRSLHGLTDEELLQIINGEKTEEQIWNEKVKNKEVKPVCEWCGDELLSDKEVKEGYCDRCSRYLETRE